MHVSRWNTPRVWNPPALLAAFVAVMWPGLVDAGSVVLQDDFDSSPLNGIPNSIQPSGDFILGVNTPGSRVAIAGAGGLYPDPFGGTGNRSLVLDAFGGGAPAGTPGCCEINEFPVVTWNRAFGDDPAVHRNATIEFDLFIPAPSTDEFWALLDFRLGYGDASRINPQTIPPDVVIWNQYQIYNRDGEISTQVVLTSLGLSIGVNFPNQQPLLADTPFRVRYVLDGATETFTWEMINLLTNESTQLTYDNPDDPVNGFDNPNFPWGFGDLGFITYPGFNSLDFQQDYGVGSYRTGEIYLDNVRVVNLDLQAATGDFNGDGQVDGADLLIWQRGLGISSGATLAQGDGDGNGAVEAADYQLWENAYGAPNAVVAQQVPEPTLLAWALSLALATSARRRRRAGAAGAR